MVAKGFTAVVAAAVVRRSGGAVEEIGEDRSGFCCPSVGSADETSGGEENDSWLIRWVSVLLLLLRERSAGGGCSWWL